MNKKDNIAYSSYCSMKSRCYNKNRDSWKYYGGRGIVVCDRWLESFDNFIKDMGDRPSLDYSIDRINPDGNYEKNNCRWATAIEQAQTKRKKVHKYCNNCNKNDEGNFRKGLCGACNEYKRRNNIDRPTSENKRKMIHSKKISKIKSIRVVQIKDGDIVKVFDRVTDAVEIYGMGVANVLSGRAKTCKGFKWEYEDI